VKLRLDPVREVSPAAPDLEDSLRRHLPHRGESNVARLRRVERSPRGERLLGLELAVNDIRIVEFHCLVMLSTAESGRAERLDARCALREGFKTRMTLAPVDPIPPDVRFGHA